MKTLLFLSLLFSCHAFGQSIEQSFSINIDDPTTVKTFTEYDKVNVTVQYCDVNSLCAPTSNGQSPVGYYLSVEFFNVSTCLDYGAFAYFYNEELLVTPVAVQGKKALSGLCQTQDKVISIDFDDDAMPANKVIESVKVIR